MKGLEISTEKANHSNWLKITLPYPGDEKTKALLLHEDGTLLRSIRLCEGNNAIDLSQIQDAHIHIKVETPYETVLKKLVF